MAVVQNVPFLLHAFYKLITPFIDPITRSKMRFNPKLVEDGLFKAGQLMKDGWGGARDFQWDHDKYWPQLAQLAGDLRTQHKARWRALGARVGLREWDYKTAANPAEEAAAVYREVAAEANEPAKAGELTDIDEPAIPDETTIKAE